MMKLFNIIKKVFGEKKSSIFSDSDVLGFMQSNIRFKETAHDRHWLLLNEDGTKKGFIWYKNLLGGWRLMLHEDKSTEWEERGVIDTVTKMKKFL